MKLITIRAEDAEILDDLLRQVERMATQRARKLDNRLHQVNWIRRAESMRRIRKAIREA